MRIVVDVDGVLADTVGAVLDWLNGSRDLRLHPNMVADRKFAILEDTSIAQAIAFFFDTRGAIGVIDGARIGTRKLVNAGHEIIVVTARPAYLRDYTYTWLWHNDILFHELHMGTEKHLFGDLVIDDSIRNVRRAREHGKKALLFAQPWNLWDLNNVTGWEFIPDAVEEELWSSERGMEELST